MTFNINPLFSPSKYSHDFFTVRKYPTYYKTILQRTVRNRGIEDGQEVRNFTAKGEAGNIGKLSNNISRAKSRVFELAFCNPWELYVTLTLNKEKYDRYNLYNFKKDLSQFIRDYRKKYSVDIKYLLVPEKHKDGAWHMHGLLYGLPIEHLYKFSLSEKLPYRIRERIESGTDVYTWKDYENKFGFSDIECIKDHEAVSKYILKYITEDLTRTITELNAHMFYASKGLKCSEIVCRDIAEHGILNPDYSNEYCSVKFSNSLDEALSAVINIENRLRYENI